MSWRTHQTTLLLRRLGRTVGVNRILAYLFSRRGYEHRFQAAMLDAVQPGDVVWDVGANVGFYCEQFSRIVGSSGKVFAFEPSLINLQRLGQAVSSLKNVTVVPTALGMHEDVLMLEQGSDPLGATSRIVERTTHGPHPQSNCVKVQSGDYMISSALVASPNVVKIDTEGYEIDVLIGLGQTLKTQRELRLLGVEVHFRILQERGLSTAPADIEALLQSSDFIIEWTDPSHIIATRTG